MNVLLVSVFIVLKGGHSCAEPTEGYGDENSFHKNVNYLPWMHLIKGPTNWDLGEKIHRAQNNKNSKLVIYGIRDLQAVKVAK
jgi:hypothetical protein